MGIVSALVVTTLVLLVTERIAVDLTAIGVMVVLALSGILTPVEAVAGFANPAVVTVGAMFLLSAGMVRTGAVGFVGQWVMRTARGSHRRAMFTTVLIVAVASAFINNTPIVVLFIPIVMSLACEYQSPPSKFLIPLSYASILGGTCTLIGTSTNIILSDLLAEQGLGALGMYELAVVGLPIALVGLGVICLAGPRLLPGHFAPTCESEEEGRYLAELRVVEGSSLVGHNPFESLPKLYPEFEVFEFIQECHICHEGEGRTTAAPGDLILAKGTPNQFVTLLKKDMELPHGLGGHDIRRSGADHVVAELIIPPMSTLVGQTLTETHLADESDLDIIAVRVGGMRYSAQRMGELQLRIGTILLVQCSPRRLESLRALPDVIVVEDVHHEIVHRDRAGLALAVFASVVVAASTGMVDIMVAALAGCFAMILGRCVSLRDAYRAIQGNVLILIVGTIALGTAMERTGTARLYGEAVVSLFEGAGPQVVLAVLIVLTSLSTQVLSNNATAVLLFPIALSMAESLGVDARPFVIAVCFGASACFATPIGYQTNLLVYGPGGYRFSDFLKLGIPINLVVCVVATTLIPVFWPLG
jgi:di/tricarboxylate transporter